MSDEQKIWWYAVGEQKFGPLTPAELMALAQQGRLSQQDMVWKQGMPDWVSASTVRQLWQPASNAAADAPPPIKLPAEPAPLAAPPMQQAPQAPRAPAVPAWSTADDHVTYAQERPTMSFGTAISTCLQKFVTFSGRASRAEYWWFYLFVILVGLGLGLVVALVSGGNDKTIDAVGNLYGIVSWIPMTAAASRRLHDKGRSGWWQLIALTGIGAFVLLYWFVQKGDDAPNQYGDPV